MAQKSSVKNDANHTKMTFERQEVKYFIPLDLVDLIAAKLDMFLRRDRYSINGYYDIYSIYFDTHDWQAFYAKMDGVIHRKKLRIRTYNPFPDPTERVFAEIKEKNDTAISKRRVAITVNETKRLMKGYQHHKRSSVCDEWRYLILKNSLRPKLLNSYQRLAYFSPTFDEIRVTLDKNVSYKLVSDIDFNQPTSRVTWSYNYCVMEIKFLKFMPAFLGDIIKDHNLERMAISKYSDSVISNFLLT